MNTLKSSRFVRKHTSFYRENDAISNGVVSFCLALRFRGEKSTASDYPKALSAIAHPGRCYIRKCHFLHNLSILIFCKKGQRHPTLWYLPTCLLINMHTQVSTYKLQVVRQVINFSQYIFLKMYRYFCFQPFLQK